MGYAVNHGLLCNAGTGEEVVLIEPGDDQGHQPLRPILCGSEAAPLPAGRTRHEEIGPRNEQAPCKHFFYRIHVRVYAS